MRYRIDFSYWHYGSGYSHTETFDTFGYYNTVPGTAPEITDYINNSDLEWNQFADYCDMIMISMYKDGKLISRAYWDEDGIRTEEFGYDADGKH